jgi:hypothetical protein
MTTTIRAIAIVTIVALIVGFCASAPAQATTYTFTGDVDSSWSTQGNWDPTDGPPDGDDVAIIPNGETVHVDSNEECGKLQVESGGTVRIFGEFRLTITDEHIQLDSVVDGAIRFWRDGDDDVGTLRIDGDVTITGNNGVIVGGDNHNSLTGGVIDGTDSSATLTLNQTGGGLRVLDEIEIKVELINNAQVGAETKGDTLTLSTNGKLGSGVWFAQGSTLKVDTQVTGAGNFLVGSSNTTGVLDVNDNLDVSGALTIRGYTTEVGEAYSTIDVASGKSAKFHVCTSVSCP